MQTDGFNKSIYNRLTTLELTTRLALKVIAKIFEYFPMENMNRVFNIK